VRVADDRGRELRWDTPPRRIVSLVPSVSETVWRLGAGDRLVGVTRYCTEPPEARGIPRCGGTKSPDLDRIAALEPDLVLLSEEENRLEDFDLLVAGGTPVFVSFPRKVDQIADWLRRLGRAVACEAAAEAAAVEVEQSLRDLRARVARRACRPRVFCPIWKRPWMSFNADTYTHAVLEACGAENVFAAEEARYCNVTLGEAAARRPDLVLLPDEPYPFAEKDIPDLGPLLAPRGSAGRVRIVDGQALSWYGARTPRGLRAIEDAVCGGIE
jgi:ABC-type Fe3+-hydroxamate transport system substrate-binding protein